MNDTLLARVTLFGLRAGVPLPDLARDRYFLLPGLRPYSEEQLVEALADLPKPARCVGFVQQGYLHVACWTKEQMQRDPVIDDLAEDARSDVDHLREEYKRAPGTLRIGVAGIAPLIVLNDAQLEQWMREYDLRSVSVRIDDAPKGSASARVDAWLHFSAPQSGLAVGHPL